MTATMSPGTTDSRLGRTLPDLLFDASERYRTERAFHRRRGGEWEVVSLPEFRARAEDLALGLLDLGLRPGDRVALFMDSDTAFCQVDFACAVAGLVSVPLYLTQAPEVTRYVLAHSGARALVVTGLARWNEVAPCLSDAADLEQVLVYDVDGDLPDSPGRTVQAVADVLERGRAVEERQPGTGKSVAAARRPYELATIIYTSGTTGRPKGVMLSHENLSSNALLAYDCIPDYAPGPDANVVLSFLPLSHVLARTMCIGAVALGSPLWFSHPDRLSEDFRIARPTLFGTVPRVLEKIYAGIVAKSETATGVRGRIARWGLLQARTFDVTRDDRRRPGLRLADRLVFARWRDAMGGRVRYVPCGGAALNPGLANVFYAAGIEVMEGFGLTETSPVITFNRPGRGRPGWVGEPLPHVEVRIEEDGEICTRGPHVMLGYFRDPAQTREVLDPDGWFHTGDIGELSADGFLRVTDRKKALFKLSTGKYVSPQPLENRLTSDPLVEQAVVVGDGFKYATALLFPEEGGLRRMAGTLGVDVGLPLDHLVVAPAIVERFRALVDRANDGMDPWSRIQRFRLVPDRISIENGLLTPTLKVRRSAFQSRFAAHIEAMYREDA